MSSNVFLPLPAPKDRIAPCTAIRSTLLASSILALKEEKLFDRYAAALEPAFRDVLLYNVAGQWLPIDAGLAHYRACDSLGLDVQAMASMGGRVTSLAHQFVLRLAKGSGVTPWTVIAKGNAYWERSYQGSAVEAFELGPKDCRVNIVANPLAAIRYWRGSLRGILTTMVGAFSQRAFVRELAWSEASPHDAAYRMSWV